VGDWHLHELTPLRTETSREEMIREFMLLHVESHAHHNKVNKRRQMKNRKICTTARVKDDRANSKEER